MEQNTQKKWYSAVLETLIIFLSFFLGLTIVFYAIWPFLPGLWSLLIIPIEAGAVLVYLKLLHRHLSKTRSESTIIRYQYCKRFFFWTFIISLLAYLGSPAPTADDYTKSFSAHLMLISLVTWTVYVFLLKKTKKTTQEPSSDETKKV